MANSNVVSREDYIKALSTVLTASEEFESLKYYEFNSKDGTSAYLRICLITGDATTFDVSNYTDAQIFNTIAQLSMGTMPENRVSDTNELIRISKLIKGIE